MTKFEMAKNEKERAERQLANLQYQIEELKNTLNRYYELLRWEELDCTEEEYEELAKNLLYPYETNNIDDILDVLKRFCDGDERKKMEQ